MTVKHFHSLMMRLGLFSYALDGLKCHLLFFSGVSHSRALSGLSGIALSHLLVHAITCLAFLVLPSLSNGIHSLL